MTVATFLEHSVEGPLGYRWLIRHFGDIYCRQGRHIFISIIGPSDLKYADRDTVVRLILVLGFRLPDSHSPASTLARSRFSTYTARLLHSFSPASQLILPLASLCLFPSYRIRVPKRPWPGSRRLFHETIHLKGSTTHWCTRRCRGSRDFVYGSADILGLLSTILQIFSLQLALSHRRQYQ